MAPQYGKWKFSAVPGIFKDYNQVALRDDKVPTQPRLGLLHREYPLIGNELAIKHESISNDTRRDWPRFASHVRKLNANAPRGVKYKVVYLTRHGVGYHNQKQAAIGNELYDNYWAQKRGDGSIEWFDSFLAAEGEDQARRLAAFWSNLFNKEGAPRPQTIYTSPLSRCLQTTDLSLRPIMPRPFRAVVKENLRERIHDHTADMRRSRSWIEANWGPKGFVVENGFIEEDYLGRVGRAFETDADHLWRVQKVLDDIWEQDNGQFLSLVCHSFTIRMILKLCGLPPFKVDEASSIALLIKGSKR